MQNRLSMASAQYLKEVKEKLAALRDSTDAGLFRKRTKVIEAMLCVDPRRLRHSHRLKASLIA